MDRYFVIVHPFRSRMRLGVCILLIIVIWIVGISISLPLAIYMRFNHTKCEVSSKTISFEKLILFSVKQEYWPQYTSRRFFNFSSLVLQYLVPFSVISFSYYKVWVALARRSLLGRTRVREEVELYRKKRTNRMLIAMVVIFAICWLPLNIVHMVAEFHREDLSHYRVSFLTTHVIAMSSTIYNPFLYSWLNDNFRKEFQEIIPCLFKIFSCFNRHKSNNNNSMNVGGDGEIYPDRGSTYQTPVDPVLNGKSNDFSMKKTHSENIQLALIKQDPLADEPLLISTNRTLIDTNLNDI